MISIITVTFNGLEVTRQLLDSLTKVGFSGETIVVDNGSRENEAEILKKEYSWIKSLRSDTNLGFAGGNNLGIRISTGDILFFLNNDTIVKDNFETEIIQFFETHPKAGVVGPKILFEYAPTTIQFAGYTAMTRITLRNNLIGYRQTDTGQYPTALSPYVLGAAMAVRRQVIEQVGELPEVYFLYYEELDWCEMIRRKGWEIWYMAEVSVFHKESWSLGAKNAIKTYYFTRNRLIFTKRTTSGIRYSLAITYQLLVALPINMVRLIAKGESNKAKAMIRGVNDFITKNY